jgi:hypothetical protein
MDAENGNRKVMGQKEKRKKEQLSGNNNRAEIGD